MKKFLLKGCSFCLLATLLMSPHLLKAQQVIPLYKGEIPGSIQNSGYHEIADTGKDGTIRISQVVTPTLTVFKPSSANNAHTAVIICPGGGYSRLAFNKEGTDIAQILAKWGVTAFVLKYRLPSDKIMKDKSTGPLMDAEQAISSIRSEATKWDIDPHRIGIMGFSAGGHLAASLSVLYNKNVLGDLNKSGVSLRPDFSILGYPVISMQKGITHSGSKQNLLGKSADQALIDEFSCDQQVTDSTPPAFLVLAADDHGVVPANSLSYVAALQQFKVPVELHMYQNGGHGFGAENRQSPDNWTERLRNWMLHNNWINKQ